ncbi:MAG TPA: sulfotransferase [Acetobacteraceae bacterium]|jgi:hypothetical protein|nr:sulfotransferase [Acetobacteraceae bacterium]
MMDRSVSIFICGVQKGGTTTLDAYFREHPDLSAPIRKELHFFDNEAQDWLNPDYGLLEAGFAGHDDRLRYDATPIYCFWPPSLARIRAYNPAAKLIFLFRDPSDRAWSQWCHEYARGAETLTFAQAIREGRSRMDGLEPLAPERRVYTYIERGLYEKQARRVLSLFPRDQSLFLRSQDLWDNHVGTLARIAAFLEIAPFPQTAPKHANPRSATLRALRPTDADRALVVDLTRDDARAFSALTGLDVSDWQVMRDVAPKGAN